MLTWIAGVIAASEIMLLGCTVKASFDGGPAVTLKVVLVAPGENAGGRCPTYSPSPVC